MPNNELNSIRIAVKNGETNESNPVNIVTSAENVEVKTDSFHGNILNYIDDLKDNIETNIDEMSSRINLNNNRSDIVYLTEGHITDSMRAKNIQLAASPAYTIDNKLQLGYRASDVLEHGVIPTVEESYEKIKHIGTGATESSDIITMNRDNFVSLINEKHIKEAIIQSPEAIYNWILNGDDESEENHIGLLIMFNENINKGNITDSDINILIKNVVYTMSPFSAFCDYVKNSASFFYSYRSIGIHARLKMYSSRKYMNKETLEMDCTKFTESDDNGIYYGPHQFAIREGKNICITVSEPNQEETSAYIKAQDYAYYNGRKVPLSIFPIILTPWNDSTIFDSENFIGKYSSDALYRYKPSFTQELRQNLAIVSAEKDDKTGKYNICKISNNESIESYTSFSYLAEDKSIIYGRYSLWLPKNIKPLIMYMQVNNSAPVQLIMYSYGYANKKKYGKWYCEETGRVKNIYIGEFREFRLPDMHIASNGTYDNFIKEYNRGVNRITIYITNMEVEFVPDRVESNDTPGMDHL